jgi:hypothetical protein
MIMAFSFMICLPVLISDFSIPMRMSIFLSHQGRRLPWT